MREAVGPHEWSENQKTRLLGGSFWFCEAVKKQRHQLKNAFALTDSADDCAN
jgi:hypothetical protein